MIITIAGDAGSGKSTVAKLLAQKLKYKHYSMGDLRRKMAEERGMTIEEFNKLGEKEAFTDKDADDYQAKLGKTEDDFVIDGRLSWKFIPHSLKVFLTVDERTAAERIFADHQKNKRPTELPVNSVDDVLKMIRERRKSDLARYNKYYNVDHLDPRHFDLVIDTTSATPERIVDGILAAAKKKKA